MDIVELIKRQVKELQSDGHTSYITIVVSHLDRAEFYYKKGNEDDSYLNDVIYRTNQAFEGALKEAYKVLGGKTDEEVSKSTPNEIEIYLKRNKVFKERVLALFENYRKEWRNKSTHDYKLIFDQSEAFLALTNVSSFVHLLLKQLQEKLSYNKELSREETKTESEEISKILTNKSDTLVQRIIRLLVVFTKELESEDNNDRFTEEEISGRLMAFLVKSDPSIRIHREPNYSIGRTNFRPDFYIQTENERIILELKRTIKGSLQAHINQILSYLNVTAVDNGILFAPTGRPRNSEIIVDELDYPINDRKLKVYGVY